MDMAFNKAALPKMRKGMNLRFRKIKFNVELYIMFFPVLLYFIIFHYLPIYGVQIAFRDFNIMDGITGSPWVGFENFQRFFNAPDFWSLLKNTLGISVYSLAAGFPIPIILALLINEVTHNKFKKFVQNVTYAPHFISTVVFVGMILNIMSPSSGIINNIIKELGGTPIHFMAKPELFKSIYVFSGVWQNAGWNAIIYLSVLSGIDPKLHESAIIDGASKLQRIWHINIPGILPTIIILLILNMGHIMNVGFEKVLLMQNPLNMGTSDVISTYVYRMGILGAQFSYTAAVGLFNNVINFILIVSVNQIAKKVSKTSLW